MTYFVIDVDDDGDVSLRKMVKQDLLDHIAEMTPRSRARILTEVPDWMMLDRTVTIILRGEVVAPVEKQVVTEYDID